MIEETSRTIRGLIETNYLIPFVTIKFFWSIINKNCWFKIDYNFYWSEDNAELEIISFVRIFELKNIHYSGYPKTLVPHLISFQKRISLVLLYFEYGIYFSWRSSNCFSESILSSLGSEVFSEFKNRFVNWRCAFSSGNQRLMKNLDASF